MTVPEVLAFADRRSEGRFAVTDPSGDVVAWIRTSRLTGTSFEAFVPTGEPLCYGRKRSWLSTWWDAHDPLDRPLASARASWWGTGATVQLPERRLRVHGKVFSRDWALRDESGRDLLTSEASHSIWGFQADAWVVRCHDPALTLAEVVGLVELHRLIVKAARSAAA